MTVILLELRARPGEMVVLSTPATSAVRRITGLPPLGTQGLTSLPELSPGMSQR